MSIPNVFATKPAGNIPASTLDDNFTYVLDAVAPSLVVETLYPTIDPTGAGDSTAAWQAAAASGLTLTMTHGAIYRLTDEITLANNTRIIGDGSQLFRQYTANIGCFFVNGDDCEVSNVSVEYMLPRAYTITGITQASPAVMTFGTDIPYVSGDRVRVTYEPTGMTQVNRTSPYLKRISAGTYEMYSNSALTTPINSTAYGAYVAGAKAAYQAPGRGKGLSGFQENCGAWLQGARATVRNFNVTNFFTAVTLRGPLTTVVKTITGITLGNPTIVTAPGHNLITGMSTLIAGVVGPTTINVNVSVTVTGVDTFTAPVDTTAQPAYVSGGTCTNFDNRALSAGLELSGIYGTTCDFAVTAGQYSDFLIERVRLYDPTEHTVPPHVIYLQNPSTTGQSYEGFVERGIIRDVMSQNYPYGRALRLSNMKDVTIETLLLDGCLSGLNLSRCYRVKVVAPNIINQPELAVGLELTDIGENNQILGGLVTGASGATFSGAQVSDTNTGTEILGTKFITDNAAWSSSSRRMVMSELQGELKASNITVYHKQANTCFAFSGTGTAKIDVILPKLNATRLILGADTAVITALIDTDLLPAGYDPTDTTWINPGTATVSLRKIADEKILTTLSLPTIAGSTVAGVCTYGAARGFGRVYRIGNMVFVSGCVQLTALDTGGTMAGNIRVIGALPYTVSGGLTGGPTTLVEVWRTYVSTLLAMQALPAAHSGVYARPVEGTTQLEIGYFAPSAVGEVWTPLTKANLTATSLIPFQGMYYTSDAL